MRLTRPRRLPSSLDDLRGLRAARWVRESTEGQYDRYGPESQHEQMDRFVERCGLVDTKIVYAVAQSGRTVWRSNTMADMLTAATAGSFDVLLTGYEAHEAERYSRRLGERITDGYAAKFRRLADPGGRAPLGFVRIPPAFVLAIDPDAIDVPVRIFERYAVGTLSIEEVASEFGLNDRRVTEMLKNPIYNGWVGRKGVRTPAPWRATPPVSDELWERVATLRASRARHGGSRRPARIDLLRGLLYCVCGQRIRTDGTMGTPPRQRKLHPRHDQCPEWGPKASHSSGVYEPWIIGQVTGIRVDESTVERIVRVLSTPETRPIDVATTARITTLIAMPAKVSGNPSRQRIKDTTARTPVRPAAHRSPRQTPQPAARKPGVKHSHTRPTTRTPASPTSNAPLKRVVR